MSTSNKSDSGSDCASRITAVGMLSYAPCFPVAVGFLGGMAIQARLSFSTGWHWTVFLGAVLPLFYRRCRNGPIVIFVGVASLAVGAAWYAAAQSTRPRSPLADLATDEGRIVRVRGRVASPPQHLPPPDNPFASWTRRVDRIALLLDTESIEGVSQPLVVSGRLRILINGSNARVAENDFVEAFGRLRSLQPPRNPGAFDWADYQRKQGIAAVLICHSPAGVQLVSAPRTDLARRAATSLRTRVRGWLTDDLLTGTPDDVGLLEALVLGHRTTIDRKINDSFLRTGLGHFLAASGTNVAILCSFIWAVSRLLRLTDRGMLWLMIAAIGINAVVADPRPPILRATIMGLLLCASFLVRRPAVHLNTLSLAAVVLLLFDPDALFDAGFQLSFAAVVGVVYLAPALVNSCVAARIVVESKLLNRRFAADNRRLIRAIRCEDFRPANSFWRAYYGLRKWLALAAATAFAAWFATLPISLTYFKMLQPWGPFNTLLIFPAVCISTWMGYGKAAVAAVFPSPAGFLAAPLRAMEDLLRFLVDRLAQLPGSSIPVPPPPGWLSAVFVAMLVMFMRWWYRRLDTFGLERQDRRQQPWVPRREPVHRALPIAFVFSLVAVAGGSVAWLTPAAPAAHLRLTVLSVGTGLSTVLELPEGGAVLYDAGSASAHDVGRGVIVPFLRHQGISRIDGIHLSHADFQHFSGLPTVLDEIRRGPVLVNRFFDPDDVNRPTRHLRRLLEERNHHIEILDLGSRRWIEKGAEFELLWPLENDEPPTVNDASTVLRVSFEGRSLLLAGDIGEFAQRRLIERGGIRADVLVLPGQGTVHPTLSEFVAAVRPEAVILSSGQRRARNPDPLADLCAPAALYNTADVGAVQVTLTRGCLDMSTPCQ